MQKYLFCVAVLPSALKVPALENRCPTCSEKRHRKWSCPACIAVELAEAPEVHPQTCQLLRFSRSIYEFDSLLRYSSAFSSKAAFRPNANKIHPVEEPVLRKGKEGSYSVSCRRTLDLWICKRWFCDSIENKWTGLWAQWLLAWSFQVRHTLAFFPPLSACWDFLGSAVGASANPICVVQSCFSFLKLLVISLMDFSCLFPLGSWNKWTNSLVDLYAWRDESARGVEPCGDYEFRSYGMADE